MRVGFFFELFLKELSFFILKILCNLEYLKFGIRSAMDSYKMYLQSKIELP